MATEQRYRAEFKDRVIGLLASDKTADYLADKRRIWDWQYEENPFLKTQWEPLRSILLTEGDEVVAHKGLVPVLVRHGGRERLAYWSIDTFVSANHRRKGHGQRLIKIAQQNELTLTFGISPIQASLLLRFGHQVNTDVEAMLRTSRATNVRAAAKRILQYGEQLRHITTTRPDTREIKLHLRPASEMPTEIDELWNRVRSGYQRIVVRTYAYMRWKYANHPLARYKLIVATQRDQLAAVGVFRQHQKTSKFVDYVGPSESLAVKYQMVQEFQRQCEASELLEFTTTDAEFKDCLAWLGFRAYRQRPTFYVHCAGEPSSDCAKNWFLMNGDSDGDLGEFEAFRSALPR